MLGARTVGAVTIGGLFHIRKQLIKNALKNVFFVLLGLFAMLLSVCKLSKYVYRKQLPFLL